MSLCRVRRWHVDDSEHACEDKDCPPERRPSAAEVGGGGFDADILEYISPFRLVRFSSEVDKMNRFFHAFLLPAAKPGDA